MVSEKDLRERIARLKAKRGLKEFELRGKRGTEKLKTQVKQLKKETSRFKGAKQFAKTLGTGTLKGIKVIGKSPRPLPRKFKIKVIKQKKPKRDIIEREIEKARQPIKQQIKFEPRLLTKQQRRNQQDRNTIDFLMSI